MCGFLPLLTTKKIGNESGEGQLKYVVLPVPVASSRQSLKSDGIYLMDNGQEICIWVGSNVSALSCSVDPLIGSRYRQNYSIRFLFHWNQQVTRHKLQ